MSRRRFITGYSRVFNEKRWPDRPHQLAVEDRHRTAGSGPYRSPIMPYLTRGRVTFAWHKADRYDLQRGYNALEITHPLFAAFEGIVSRMEQVAKERRLVGRTLRG
jgi:hypothetical protein